MNPTPPRMPRLLLLGLLLGLAAPVAALAQQAAADTSTHRLEIRDGRVYHDGVELPDSAVPEGLDVAGHSFSFEYSGPVMPALFVNGKVYALDGERLVALEDAGGPENARAVAMMPVPTAEDVAEEDRRRAEQAYLQTLSERDRALYERLLSERDKEMEIRRLAYVFRRSSAEDDRQRLRARLHNLLDEAFELKQETRREEIRRAEDMIHDARNQLQVREGRRDEIVRQRLRDLTGTD